MPHVTRSARSADIVPRLAAFLAVLLTLGAAPAQALDLDAVRKDGALLGRALDMAEEDRDWKGGEALVERAHPVVRDL